MIFLNWYLFNAFFNLFWASTKSLDSLSVVLATTPIKAIPVPNQKAIRQLKFNEVDKKFYEVNQELVVLKTILIMKNIMPVELANTRDDNNVR